VVVVGGVGHAQEDADRFVALRGMVTDTALRPVPGVLVYLSWARILGQSDDNGEFTLAEVEPGVDTLQIRARGFMPRAFQLLVADSVQGTIDMGNFKLDPGPLPTLALTATVRDTLQDQPVIGAQVLVNDSVVGETDTAGVFSATEIPIDWGINVVVVRSVGYSVLYRTIWVEELNTQRAFHGAMQQQAVDLPAVVVEGDRIIFSYGRLREFWQRRERGWGRFFTRADIERRHPIHVSDMLFTIPGISVFRVRGTTQILSTRFGQRCGPSIWIDGMRLFDSDLDALVHPQDVEAIEVYTASAVTPVEFGGGFNPCGAIVIWTR
jgi:hypothetical protein